MSPEAKMTALLRALKSTVERRERANFMLRLKYLRSLPNKCSILQLKNNK